MFAVFFPSTEIIYVHTFVTNYELVGIEFAIENGSYQYHIQKRHLEIDGKKIIAKDDDDVDNPFSFSTYFKELCVLLQIVFIPWIKRSGEKVLQALKM